MAPTHSKGAAALGASQSLNGKPKVLQRIVRDLQDGQALLQQPYSPAGAVPVFEHLRTSYKHMSGGAPQGHTTHLWRLLQLLDQYLLWLLPSINQQPSLEEPPAAAATTTTNSSSSRDGPSHSSSRPTSNLQLVDVHGHRVPLQDAPIFMCFLFKTTYLFAAYATVVSLQTEAPAALFEQLVAPKTGTLSLLGQAASLLLADPTGDQRRCLLGPALYTLWSMACALAYPSRSSGSRSIYGQLPHNATEVSAVADLLHWWFLQPRNSSSCSPPVELYLAGMTLQLQHLVQGAAAAGWGWMAVSSRFQQQQQEMAQQPSRGRPQQDAAPGVVDPQAPGTPCGAHVPTGVVEMCFPANARAQVERFLWHALATATAALYELQGGAPSAPAGGFSSSSSSSSTGVSDRAPRWVQARGGYAGCQLTQEQASDICYQAASALLQLATADVPQAQCCDMAAASMYLQDETRAQLDAMFAKFTANMRRPPPRTSRRTRSASGSSSSSNSSSSSTGAGGQDTSAGARPQQPTALQCLCWPFASEAEGHGRAHHSSSSSSSNGDRDDGTRLSHGNALGTQEQRLQLLAAAVATMWGCIWQQPPGQQDKRSWATLVHMLVFLAQQVQAAPAPMRAAFLHGPAGSAVLCVLTAMSAGDMSTKIEVRMLLSDSALHPAALAAQQHLQKGAEQDVQMSVPALVEVLLLPGLLLQPATVMKPDTAAGAATAPAAAGAVSDGSTGGRRSSAGRRNSDGRKRNEGPSGGNAEGSSSSGSSSSSSSSNRPADVDAPDYHGAVMTFGKGTLVPLLRMPRTVLQLPQGCIPPPAAFFLVERLVREAPSAANTALALQLLHGSVGALCAAEQEHQQQQSQDNHVDRPETDHALQRLSFCSLVSSVVQALMREPPLGVISGGVVWGMVGELVSAACAYSAGLLLTSSGSSSGGNGGRGKWGLAASLMAAVSAVAYATHLHHVGVSMPTCAGATGAGSRSSSRGTSAGGASNSSPVADSVTDRSAGRTGGERCSADCTICAGAAVLWSGMACLERSASWQTVSATAALTLLEQRAQQRGTTLQQHLQQRLLALAWRHPVPCVCGNVLCRGREGSSAVGMVFNRVGTLCGGCRAVWYCCEECQDQACPGRHTERCAVVASDR